MPDARVLILSAAIIFATHLVGAIAAYGSTLLALPLMVWVVGDLRTSVVTLLIVGIVQSYQVAAYTYKDADWRELRQMAIWMGLGLPIGFLSMSHLPQRLLLVVFGAILVVCGAVPLWRRSRKSSPPPNFVLKSLLVAGGIIHGAFACGGATLAIYAQHALVQKERMRGTLSMVWVVMQTVMVANAVMHGWVTPRVAWLAATALPFLLLGSWLGDQAARRMRQQSFAQLLAVLLVVAGVITILRVA